jgi:hypothetical protein
MLRLISLFLVLGLIGPSAFATTCLEHFSSPTIAGKTLEKVAETLLQKFNPVLELHNNTRGGEVKTENGRMSQDIIANGSSAIIIDHHRLDWSLRFTAEKSMGLSFGRELGDVAKFTIYGKDLTQLDLPVEMKEKPQEILLFKRDFDTPFPVGPVLFESKPLLINGRYVKIHTYIDTSAPGYSIKSVRFTEIKNFLF